MAETPGARHWIMRSAFVALALAILFWQLLPLSTVPRNWTGPDFLLVTVMAWVLRRPDYAPVFAVAAIMLLADFVLGRPPGLMAGVTVFACEKLRKRVLTSAEMAFPVEWLTAATAMALIIISTRVITAIFLLPQPSLGLTLIQLIMCILAYPLVAALCAVLLGIRKTRFREGEAT
ncbi:hypothetical protein [Cognatishimia maritima]|uniref:Rod shape-determining protein MreD n=1 Tax=Cognatishimia maritima TaxID=870908 RepID=A0A1M5S273_9RHOB|nr:hypothetical protein [Cognatishimia maritima]SHH32697.1 rod shape-determining protein MreD [Cognatishimia maritima]